MPNSKRVLIALAACWCQACCKPPVPEDSCGEWQLVTTPEEAAGLIISGIGTDASGAVWLAGMESVTNESDMWSQGSILRGNGTQWFKVETPDLGTDWALNDLAVGEEGVWFSGTHFGGFTGAIDIDIEEEKWSQVESVDLSDLGEPEDKINLEAHYQGPSREELLARSSEMKQGAAASAAVAMFAAGSAAPVVAANAIYEPLLRVAGFGADSAWFATESTILRYDGGTWAAHTPPGIGMIRDIAFVSEEEGWAAGLGTTGKATVNQGAMAHLAEGVWSEAVLPTFTEPWELMGLSFLSSTQGWACGVTKNPDTAMHSGIILQYGGEWLAADVPSVSSDWYLEDICFSDPDRGWAIGRDNEHRQGVLLCYLNGIWEHVSLSEIASTDWSLSAMDCAGAERGWLTGYDNEHGRVLLFRYAP
ncbi:MAG: hypothetical protein HYZ00_07625 [Candidatus Hydrogenedentes bacterium]|nr:hypothetical protein [Candidatus Hydrogenedentota bacterium]